MRYKAEWLLECLLLRIKSPSAYQHLIKTELIPVPSAETLRNLIGGMSCHFGFNSHALHTIKERLKDASDSEKLVVLCFDEIALLEELGFNVASLAFDGFVRLSDDPLENRPTTDEDEENFDDEVLKKGVTIESLADHALVFFCRSLLLNFVAPFGVFASRSAASGIIL